nr:glycosyltransferase family 2 protein [uncultured Flavobacterium sp.]
MFDVAVIIVNYNSSKYTVECIQSVIEKTDKSINYQVIVVDNASAYADYLAVKDGIENITSIPIKLIRSRINTGFGGGNMAGVLEANAKYLLFLNNDTLLKNDCISIVKNALENNPEIGIAGPQAYKGDGSFMVSLDHFASPARELFSRNVLEKINPKRYPKRKKKYTEPVKIDYVPGSFMFLKAEDFHAVGGFDNNLFLYYEETDLCIRLKKIGKHAWLIPQAEFIHFHGGSTGSSLAIKKELKISVLYVMRKHYGILGHFSVHLYLIIKYLFSSLVKPKYLPLLGLLLRGAPITESLKLKQVILDK